MKKILSIIVYLALTLALSLIVLLTATGFYLSNQYEEKVFPNVYFDGEDMSGKTLSEVEAELKNKVTNLKQELVLKYEDKEVKVKISDLGFSWNDENTAKEIYNLGKEDGKLNRFFSLLNSFFETKEIDLTYSLDDKKANSYMVELATTIDKESLDGKFEIKNGKVVDFEIGKNGQKLLIDENIALIEEAIINQEEFSDLEIEVASARGMEDMEKMGVKELFATGESNFAGSPPNRIHNITIGAQAFNGILIAPGEEFSFITYLGEVSAKTGYLPELVIKEDKTIPEYGGGLCQVSTTFFRTAINAGFPILERSPHAYRVGYYEPAGFDSTIYQPKPDLIFQNNTEYHILVQARIVSSKLFVDFYGTPDGRKVEVSEPTVYNYVQPGDPIITETTDLPPGEKKQTDIAHVGASAYFTRKIIYADGEVKDERFDSKYIPWRAKFLVGKEPEPETPPEETLLEEEITEEDSIQLPDDVSAE